MPLENPPPPTLKKKRKEKELKVVDFDHAAVIRLLQWCLCLFPKCKLIAFVLGYLTIELVKLYCNLSAQYGCVSV